MYLIVWAFSGLLASSYVSVAYPNEFSSITSKVAVVGFFLLLGMLDLVVTLTGKNKRRSVKFR